MMVLLCPWAIASLVSATIALAFPAVPGPNLDLATSVAGNPFVEGWYADPDTEFYQGEYWVFPTSSYPSEQQTYLDAFSSPDLIHWAKHPNVLKIVDVKWAKGAIWAPAPVSRHGRYYLYFGANALNEGQAENGIIGGIGVAIANSPEGPYLDAIGKPLIGEYHNGAQPIDQDVFIDDDGQAYIFYGGHGHCNMAKLNDDMVSIGNFEDGTSYKEITPQGYVEGPQMIKRNGKYYLMWSEGSWTGPDYSVSYAMSDSIMGPFTKRAQILRQDPAVAKGSGHNGVIHIPNTDIWYIVYHRRALSETDGNHRVLAYDRMYFNDDGTIKPVTMLVQDNFADGKTIAWKEYGCKWSAIDQRLTSLAHGIAMLDTNFGDLVYEATVMVPSGEAHVGLLFRASNVTDDYVYMNGYFARISASGGATLERLHGGESTVLGPNDVDTTAPDPPKEYHVKVRAVGSHICIFVEDMQTPKVEVVDGTFSTGQNGVSSSAPGTKFGFVSIAKAT